MTTDESYLLEASPAGTSNLRRILVFCFLGPPIGYFAGMLSRELSFMVVSLIHQSPSLARQTPHAIELQGVGMLIAAVALLWLIALPSMYIVGFVPAGIVGTLSCTYSIKLPRWARVLLSATLGGILTYGYSQLRHMGFNLVPMLVSGCSAAAACELIVSWR